MLALYVISSPLADKSLRAFDPMAFDRRSGQDKVKTTFNVLAVRWAALALIIVVARLTAVAMERIGDYVHFGSDSSRQLQPRKRSTSFRYINGQTSATIDRLTSMFPGGTEILLSLT